MDDSTLSAYNPQLLGLYTQEWRLRKSIYVEQNRPNGFFFLSHCILLHFNRGTDNGYELYMDNRLDIDNMYTAR